MSSTLLPPHVNSFVIGPAVIKHTHTHTQMLDLTQEVHGRMLMTIMSKLGISDEDYEV